MTGMLRGAYLQELMPHLQDIARSNPSPDAVDRRNGTQARILADRLSGMKVGTGRAHLSRNDADNIAAMALRILMKGEGK